jgi:hypothetical protein
MDIPVSFENTVGIVIVAIMVVLFLWMHHRRRRFEGTLKTELELEIAYEWAMTPARKAKKELLNRFPELAEVVETEFSKDLALVRFAVFNMSKEIIPKEQFVQPVEIHFPISTMILSARFGEALKMTRRSTLEPVIKESSVLIPPETMSPRSTLIYNFILLGNTGPDRVSGEVEGKGHIKRVR